MASNDSALIVTSSWQMCLILSTSVDDDEALTGEGYVFRPRPISNLEMGEQHRFWGEAEQLPPSPGGLSPTLRPSFSPDHLPRNLRLT